mgnify:CR=1 FL=1
MIAAGLEMARLCVNEWREVGYMVSSRRETALETYLAVYYGAEMSGMGRCGCRSATELVLVGKLRCPVFLEAVSSS